MKYKVRDKVRIKSLDWYNENKDEDGIVEFSTHIFTPGMSQFCGKVMTIEDFFEDTDGNVMYYMEEIDYDWTDEMFEGLVEEKITNVKDEDKMLIGWIKEPNRYRLVPDKDYEIKYDEKGFFYLEKKKKEYPKTFEECVHVLEGENRMSLEQMNTFRKLVDARNAYWKIAGEEMGLGKPWSPIDSGVCYGITSWAGKILHETTVKWCILTFPTEEMRDAFYENFKDLIEECKELL